MQINLALKKQVYLHPFAYIWYNYLYNSYLFFIDNMKN